jgi:hypothetical protein
VRIGKSSYRSPVTGSLKYRRTLTPSRLSQAVDDEIQTHAPGRAAQVPNAPSLPCLEDLLKTPTHRRACLTSRPGERLQI